MRSVLLFKYTLTLSLFFLITATVYRKKFLIEKNSFFAADYVKIIELHVVHT